MRHLILLGIVISFFSCKNEVNKEFAIKGTATGFADGTEIYLEDLVTNNKRVVIDTAIVKEGVFYFKKPQKGTKTLQLINVAGIKGQLLLVKDTAPLSVTLFKDSIHASIVKGSEENELFNSYRNNSRIESIAKNKLMSLLRTSKAETDGIMENKHLFKIKEMDNTFISKRKDLISKHSDKMVSIIALSDLINAKVITGKEVSAYFDGFTEDIKKSVIGKAISKYAAQQKAQEMAAQLASIGNKAPDFSAKTPDGKELSLKDALGTSYTLVDFWASWCRPCRMENPNVVNVYNKYHKKGLNIISVSLDRPGQKDRWIRAIKQDKMDWHHVSNLSYWQDPIPKSYGVRALPTTFLLDENGVIIAKNIRGGALGVKMEQLLGY